MIGAIMGGVQAALGIGQTIAGLVKKKPEIPDYEIPQEVWDNMTDAEYWAMEGLPPAQKQQFIEQSQRSGATALSRSSDRKGGLGLVSSIAQQEQDAATQLLSMDAAQRMENIQNLYRARANVSAAKDIKYERDLGKVMQERAEVDALRGAGVQNIMNAAGTVAGIDALSDDGIFGGEGGGLFSKIGDWIGGIGANKRHKETMARSKSVGMTSAQVKSALDLDPYPFMKK